MSTSTAATPTRRLASLAAAADYVGVHPRTIRRRIAAGDLTAYHFGPRLLRVNLNELEAALHRLPTAGRDDAA
jgi:excisionase family DNA binding protein